MRIMRVYFLFACLIFFFFIELNNVGEQKHTGGTTYQLFVLVVEALCRRQDRLLHRHLLPRSGSAGLDVSV